MKTLIIGEGEIGSSLFNVLSREYDTYMRGEDVLELPENLEFDIIHIAFPYSDKFIEFVEKYRKRFKPKYVVVHSTVPVGTCSKLKAIHSPCIGIHPDLTESLYVFTKYLGGQGANEVANYFRRAGIKVYIVDKSEATEYMKIMSTTFYGLMIEFTKQVKLDCKKLDIPFELFTLWNINYNNGYEKLGYPEYKKPILTPILTEISGHCVLPNTKLLENDFTELIKRRNN